MCHFEHKIIRFLKTLLLIALLDLLSIIQVGAQIPKWEWAKRYGGSEGYKRGNSIVLDNYNNLYVAGSYYTDLKIENTTIIATKFNDLFIAKFSEVGTLIWIKSAGGPVGDNAASMTLLDNFLYLIGSFDYQITFENTQLQTDLTGSIFLAKYDLNGNLVWIHYLGAGGSGACISSLNITNDKNKYLYLTGCLIHEQGKNVKGKGYNDVSFITKTDTAGNILWTKNNWGNSFGSGRSIKIDNNGFVYNTGCFEDTIIVGELPGNHVKLISYGDKDAYITKHDPNGELVWVHQLGGSMVDEGISATTDSYNNVYFTGSFENTANFQDTILTSAGKNDIFIIKLDSFGNRLWVKQIGSTGRDYGRFILADNTNHFYLTANFHETISIGDTSLTAHSYDEYASEAFIAKYKNSGEFVWVKEIGTQWDIIETLASNNNNDIYITGSLYWNTIHLDNITLQPKGPVDLFLAKINEDPSLVEETNENYYIKLFPNPTERILNIQINAPRPDNLSLEIYTVTGKLLLKRNFYFSTPEFKGEIDLSDLPVGMYIVIIKGDLLHKIERIIII